jgi:hypothetical protein
LKNFKIFISFFHKLNLTNLRLFNVIDTAFGKDFFEKENTLSKSEKCNLVITLPNYSEKVKEIYDLFVFGKLFAWNKVLLYKASDTLHIIKEIDLESHLQLKKLRILHFNNEFATNQKFTYDLDSFTVIGSQLIYNEASFLKELLFEKASLEP